MNIHIVPDEKFIDTFIEIAESISTSENIFLVRSNPPFKYIKSKSVIAAPVNGPEFKKVLGMATANDVVHIHYLSLEMCDWLGNTSCPARFTWLFWGSEFYEAAGVDFNLYESLTVNYSITANNADERLSRFWLLHKYRYWQKRRMASAMKKKTRDLMAAAVSKLSFILHYNRLDYDLICQYFPTSAQFQYFNYPPPYTFKQIDDIIEQILNPLPVKASNINCWLGNSGFPANNHLDYLFQLGNMDISNLKVWAPLNYGDIDYIEHVIQSGHLQLPGKFQAITEYMSFDGFMKVIQSMDVSIMAHKRPQAFGNIQLLLYFGKKIFMDDNTLYRFLIDQGYHIFSVNELSKTSLETPLSIVEQNHNRMLINAQFTKEIAKLHIAKCLQL